MKTIRILFLSGFFLVNLFGAHAQQNTPQSSINVVKIFLSAYQQKKHDVFVSLLDPAVTWRQPGNNRISGTYTSKDALLQFGAKMSQLTGKTLSLEEVFYFEGDENTVTCMLHWKAKNLDNQTLDIRNIDVYRVENGKIVEAKVFSENIEIEDQFWGKL